MEIFISRDGQQFGPYTLSEVQTDLNTGNIVAGDLAWHEGAADWVEISEIAGLVVPRKRLPPPPPPGRLPPTGGTLKLTNVQEVVAIAVISLLIPLVGLVVGGIWMAKPERYNDGMTVLGIAILFTLFYMVVFLGGAALIFG